MTYMLLLNCALKLVEEIILYFGENGSYVKIKVPHNFIGGRGRGKSATFRIIPDHPNRPTPHNRSDRTSKPARRR